jgi:hypothetical protein
MASGRLVGTKTAMVTVESRINQKATMKRTGAAKPSIFPLGGAAARIQKLPEGGWSGH